MSSTGPVLGFKMRMCRFGDTLLQLIRQTTFKYLVIAGVLLGVLLVVGFPHGYYVRLSDICRGVLFILFLVSLAVFLFGWFDVGLISDKVTYGVRRVTETNVRGVPQLWSLGLLVYALFIFFGIGKAVATVHWPNMTGAGITLREGEYFSLWLGKCNRMRATLFFLPDRFPQPSIDFHCLAVASLKTEYADMKQAPAVQYIHGANYRIRSGDSFIVGISPRDYYKLQVRTIRPAPQNAITFVYHRIRPPKTDPFAERKSAH